MAGLRPLVAGRTLPGDGSRTRLDAARRAGTLDVPDDLWAWLAAH
jgi:hypothetical protein